MEAAGRWSKLVFESLAYKMDIPLKSSYYSPSYAHK